MSFPISRGRGRGNSRGTKQAATSRNAPSGPSNTNGNVPNGPARGGYGARRGTFGAGARGNGAQIPRGGRGGNASRGNTFNKPPARRAASGGAMSGGPLKDRYEQLKKTREIERKDAERQGIVSAPGQARLLSDAVTPVGTCLDMCAEWERVERAFQNNVAPEELDPDQSAYAPGSALPVEARMVKKFKRPGAGDGDQLPSDLRPPHVLKATCDYLFRDLLANAPSMASVHGFIWDRTRAIRNDFSIQQVTKLDDVRIAIECFERIARFHILALHQMATPESRQQARKAESTYDPQQEREQLDRTLLSLMQYYDDYRGRIELANEAEFRSYCVIFQLDSSQTDTEDRVQTWPKALLGDRTIQGAMQLFAAACTTFRRLGPFKALATEHVVARQDWEGFWKLINSTKISYLQACVAEIYFHLLRDMVLRSIVRAMRPSKPVNGRVNPSTDWSMHDLRDLFHFDDDDQLVAFCALYDLDFHEVGDEDYLDVSPVAGKTLQTPTFGKAIQESSWVVEQKRHGRSWAAVIDGMNVQQAHDAGMIEEVDANEEMADAMEDQEANGSAEEDPESLFIPEAQKTGSSAANNSSSTTAAGFMSGSPFGLPSGALGSAPVLSNTSIFGQPSSGASLSKPSGFGILPDPAPNSSIPVFGQPKPTETTEKKPSFNFLNPTAPTADSGTKPATMGTSAFRSMTSASLFSPQSLPSTTAPPGDESADKPATKPFASPFGQPAAITGQSLFAPKQDNNASADAANPFKSGGLFAPRQDSNNTSESANSSKAPSLFAPNQDSSTSAESANPFKTTSLFAPKQDTTASADANPFKSANLFAPKQDTTASADNANPFKATTQSNPFLAPTATPPASQEKLPAPAPFNFSRPEQSQSVPSLFSGLSAPAAPSVSAPEETNAKSTAAQNPFTAPSQPQPPTTSNSTSQSGQDVNSGTAPTGSQSPPRRSSINNLPDTKPKKPSPLSHSFTFSEDNSSLGGASQIKRAPSGHPVEELFPGRQKTSLPPSFTQTKPTAQPAVTQQAVPDFDAVLTRISEELTTDPVSGFLKQYVDYTVKQVITQVQEDLYRERMNSEADEFRTWFLQDKFGKRWRDTCRRQRLAKQGRERRKRAQRRLHESQRSDAHNFGDIQDTASSLRSSRATSVANHQNRREMVDAMYKSTASSSRFSGDAQAQAGSKRSVSSHVPDSSMLPAAESSHKRMKSTSHIDDRGRVVMPQTSRSSFLGFSLANDAPSHTSTTKSPYFRMKALGIKSSGDAGFGLSRGTKRPRSDSIDTDQQSRLSSSLLGSSPDQLREGNNGLMRPPPARSVRSKTTDDDEALFARLKAAREGLMESGSFMRSEVEKDSELRRSASSLSDRESPSLARARAEVRRQATEADSDFGASLSGREVPAYRLRESRFVPREHYLRARERASEIVASRSEHASRSESRAGGISFSSPTEEKVRPDARLDAIDSSISQPDFLPATVNGQNDSSAMSGLFSNVAPAVQPSDIDATSFTGFDGPAYSPRPLDIFGGGNPTLAAPAPPTINGAPNPFLEDSQSQESQNPFLQAPVSNGSFISQTQTNTISTTMSQPSLNIGFGFGGPAINNIGFGFGGPTTTAAHDNSIQPSQIDNVLARSFGQPQPSRPSSFGPPAPAPSTNTLRPFGTSKAVSEVFDEERFEEEAGDGMDVDDGDDDDSQSNESVQFNPNASGNRFAMLLDQDDEVESQGSALEEQPGHDWNSQADEEPASDEEQTETQPDSYQHDDGATEEYDSDNGEEFEYEQGDVQRSGNAAVNEGEESYSEEDEDAEDEMDYDSEEEGSYDEDDDDGHSRVPQAAFGYVQPQPNEALQAVGNHVEEAIELSD